MPNPIVELVREEMQWFREVRAEFPSLFPIEQDAPTLYPMPFFGDIRRADVLTMTLNPSWKEFSPARCWPSGLDADALTTRLLHYFDIPHPSPHPFFAYRQPMLNHISRSYRNSVAHVDLLSIPTLRPGADGMSPQQRQLLLALANQNARRLQRVLNLACLTKIILLWNLTVGDGENGQWTVWGKATEHVPLFQNHIASDGSVLPLLQANNPDALANRVANQRDEIREYLVTGPRLCHANYG